MAIKGFKRKEIMPERRVRTKWNTEKRNPAKLIDPNNKRSKNNARSR